MELFKHTGRLHAAVQAVCPIDSVSVTDGTPPTVQIRFMLSATPAQQAAANSVVASFDWSQAAEDADANLRARTLVKARFQTNPDVDGKALRALALILMDEINILRVAGGLQPRTLAQLKVAFANRIDGGTID